MKTKKDLIVVISMFADNPVASTKKKGKMTIMDLNNEDSAGEDENDEGVADVEKKAMASHVHLSFNQRRAWAVSLACGTTNVTKITPPQGDLFSMFHRKAKDGTTPGPAGPPAQYNSYYPYPMPPLFGGLPPAFPGYHPHPPAASQLPSGSAIHPQLSSDPAEEDVS
ncbi:hypothetical protein B0H13DRAFT_2341725 [Mycena leptocephala]|nr:hypothetical protein B0H13DRAFT_2341725 [Mycena leptocephala]